MATPTSEKTLLIEIMTDNLSGRQADQLELSFSLGLFEKLALMGFTTASSQFSPFSGPDRLAKYLHDARPYRDWPITDAKLAALLQAKPQRLDAMLDALQTG